MAGRRERARVVVVFGLWEEEVVGRAEAEAEGVVVAVEGARRERSSMKFPAATLEGVRGRWRVRVMS